jgi:UDP-glucose-4-epimerase GalE
MTTVLVTGGAGYIGSHTAKALALSGFEPVVLDNLSAGHRWAVRWGPFVEGDLADAELIRAVLSEYRPAAIVHFAASAYVGESMVDPRKYFRNNVANTLNLLEAALDAGVRAVVFSSTCATYGLPDQLPIGESQPQRPINPYGESKLFVEQMLRRFGDAYGLRSVALRYFNAAGADPDGELGEDHEPETHLIPLTLRAATGRGPTLDILGSDYPTPDGTAVRDYIHVTDLAEAHLAALRYLLDGGRSTALNLGTGQGCSVRQVVEAVERAAQRPLPTREMPRRPGDPPALVADATQAAAVLGWKPRHSSLDEIVATAWRWHTREATAIAHFSR